jgi:cytochrome c oxidase subunit 1
MAETTAPVAVVPPVARTGGLLELAGPMLRALLWGIAGFALGALATAAVTGTTVADERAVTVGYLIGALGWIGGGGAWEAWVRPWFGYPDTWAEGFGAARYLRFATDHKVIGVQYLVSSLLALGAAGLFAMVMRAELLTPEIDVVGTAQTYNAFVGVHGTLMIFSVAVVAIVGGFGNYFVPLMIGAEDMTFPKLNGVSWWFVVPGVLAILLSPLMGGFETGWTGYQPLGSTGTSGQILYYLGTITLGISSLLTAINVVATTVYLRAPGLSVGCIPMFVWSMVFTSILALLWLPVVTAGFLLALSDRLVPTGIFSAEGGLPLLWQDLFWLFGHPEVYIIMLGAWGLWLEIVPVMSRKSLFSYRWALAGFGGITLLSSMVWVHHMFTAAGSVRWIPFMSTTELISIPTGLMYLVVIGTLWKGRIHLTTPMLFALFSILNFLIGGATGIFLADVPSDIQLQDTFFVVAHFHYTIVGGMIFAFLAGLHYWFPKITGRRYREGWGKLSAWWLFVFFNLTFLPMFASGIEGMNRRIAEYLPYLQPLNVVTSVGGFLFGIGFLIVAANLIGARRSGPPAESDPWGGQTLEWRTSSPPPRENFAREPVVTAGFYTYGPAGSQEVPAPRQAEERP